MRGLTKSKLSLQPNDLGSLLESFVYNELVKQSEWIDETLQFYHFRDSDKNEVDIIIEDGSGNCFAIEVKARASLNKADFKGLEHFKKASDSK